MIATICKSLIVLLINPLLAKNLSSYDYSVMGFYSSISALVTPIISFALFRYYSKSYFKINVKEHQKLLNVLCSTQMILSFFEILLLNIVLIILKISTDIIKFPLYPYIFYIFTVLIFNNIYAFLLLDFKLKKNAKMFFKYSLSNAIVSGILAVLLVVYFKWGASGRLLALFITGLVFGILAFKRLEIKLTFDKKIMKDAFLFCWPLTIAGALGYFFSGFDRGMLALKENNHEYALYVIALKITGFLSIFTTAIGQTFMPDFFKFVALKNYKKLLLILGIVISLSVIPVLFFNFFAEFILELLTSGRYTEAAKYARILSLKNVSMTIYSTMSVVIVAFGFSKATLVNKIIGSFISIYMFRYLISNYSFVGAAWGQVLSFLLLSFISFLYILYKYKAKRKRT